MKKMLGLLGGLILLNSVSGNTASCSKTVDYTFILITDRNEVVDTFDKREVEDYYFDNFFDEDKNITIIIKFKSTNNFKKYPFKSGDCAYWLKELVTGLNLKPAQEKYEKRSIPDWAWQNAGLWDYENNRPKD